MKVPAINDMFETSFKSKLNTEYTKTTNVTSISSEFLDKVKKDLIPDIPSFDNIMELPSSALGTLATSIGVDKNSLKKIMDIAGDINLSDIMSGDINTIKQKLLEKLELKNLVEEALNPEVLKMLAESIGISEKNLENMLKTSSEVKTFSDIKTMEMYEKLDTIFKKKLIEDNGLTDSVKALSGNGVDLEGDSEKLLKTVVYVSTLLYSKSEDDRKLAETEAKKLQPEFLLLFKNRNSEEGETDRLPMDQVPAVSPWLENFSKIDYRVQKVAALAFGFGEQEEGVLKLRDTIELLNRYKSLDDESNQKREGLLEHLNDLDRTTAYNSNSIQDYKEEHGLTDEQFDNACKITFSSEMAPKDPLLDPSMCTEGFDPDTLEEEDFNDPIFIIGLNPAFVIRNETTNEILGYNGDVIFTDNRNQVTGEKFEGKLPFKLKTVNGNFICKDMKLTDLTNAPDFVQGTFDCSLNDLTTLQGSPKTVNGKFDASYNFLTTIEGMPTSIGNGVNLENNDLTNLDISYSVTILNDGDFDVSNNYLTSLASGDITGIGTLNVNKNKLVNTGLTDNSLLRIRKGITAKHQTDGPIDIKILQEKFGTNLKYDV
jgi:hypothetical protein